MPPRKPPLPLVSREEMARLQVRSGENDKLAECWSRDDAVFITMNWRSMAENGGASASLSIEIMQQGVPLEPGRFGGFISRPQRRLSFYVTTNPRWGSHVVHPSDDITYYYDVLPVVAKAELQKVFGELARRYSKVCVCSLRPRNVINGLGTLGFRLPNRTVMVDLVKVVEFQSAPENIGEALDLEGNDLVERQTRYGVWTGAGHLNGNAYPSRVLVAVGPKAHAYQKDLRRIERETKAAERLRVPLGAREVMKIKRERPRA